MNKNRQLLIDLMQISEQQYEDKLFNSAYEFLRTQIGHDDWGIQILTSAPLFWRWWTNQWNRRNKILVYDFGLERFAGRTDISAFVRKQYNEIHEISNLTIRPSKPVIDEAYALMIGNFIDAVHQHNQKHEKINQH